MNRLARTLIARGLLSLAVAMVASPVSASAQGAAATRGSGTQPAATDAGTERATDATGTPRTERRIIGRVRRPVETGGDSTGMGPAIATWVTLHRVGKDAAGPIDSTRTDGQGRYQMRWRPSGTDAAVYFASVTWGGIAYFTPPLRAVESRGDDAEITVFDTTSRAFPLAVKGRHLIVGMLDSVNTRTVVEVFELSNDSLLTLVANETAAPTPTWSLAIPQAAVDVRVTEGEISPDAFAYGDGRVSVFAPIAPGLKQIAFSYRLPAASFPIRVTADLGAVVFEVLLEEPQGTVRGDGFTMVDPVSLESRTFRRFLAQDVKPGADVIIELPVTRTLGRKLYLAALLVAIGFLLLLVLSRSMQRRASRSTAAVPVPGLLRTHAMARVPDAPLHERLAHEIAALDAHFARQNAPSDAVREAYEARRAELKEALAEALATPGATR